MRAAARAARRALRSRPPSPAASARPWRRRAAPSCSSRSAASSTLRSSAASSSRRRDDSASAWVSSRAAEARAAQPDGPDHPASPRATWSSRSPGLLRVLEAAGRDQQLDERGRLVDVERHDAVGEQLARALQVAARARELLARQGQGLLGGLEAVDGEVARLHRLAHADVERRDLAPQLVDLRLGAGDRSGADAGEAPSAQAATSTTASAQASRVGRGRGIGGRARPLW